MEQKMDGENSVGKLKVGKRSKMIEKSFIQLAIWQAKEKIIPLLKGVERVTKALPGVSWYKIACFSRKV